MKTPEEIAAEVAERRYIGSYSNHSGRSIGGGGYIRAVAVAAIEADRKQRNPGSASDRDERARAALAEHDKIVLHTGTERRLAETLRLFVGQPLANESAAQIARRIMDDPHRTGIDWQVYQPNEEQVLDIATQAATAGMDAAFESWEPDDYAEPETVAAALRRALLDRGDTVAADWVAAHEAELWGDDIGPLLDGIQRDHGGH